MLTEGNSIPHAGGFGGGSGAISSLGWAALGQGLVFGAYYGLAIGLILADGPLPAGDAVAMGMMGRLALAAKQQRGLRSAAGFGMLLVPDAALVPVGNTVGEFLENTVGSTGLPGSHSMWVGPEVWWFYE